MKFKNIKKGDKVLISKKTSHDTYYVLVEVEKEPTKTQFHAGGKRFLKDCGHEFGGYSRAYFEGDKKSYSGAVTDETELYNQAQAKEKAYWGLCGKDYKFPYRNPSLKEISLEEIQAIQKLKDKLNERLTKAFG